MALDNLVTAVRDGIREGSTDETQLDLLVAKLRDLADGWQLTADEIRPGGDDVDYELDGVDDIENEAIATQLEECARGLLAITGDYLDPCVGCGGPGAPKD